MTSRVREDVESILARYSALICDLDGVVYRGSHAVAGSVDVLQTALASGRSVVFATNNASREPRVVEDHLGSLGLGSGAWCVVTSAQAAAQYVAAELAASSPVLAVGGPGVAQALREVGLLPFGAGHARHFGQAAAVVQGAGSNVNWRDLAESAHQVRGGAMWVATNADRTIPTSRGLAPGNGALVEAVRAAVDINPVVVGKPERYLYDIALRQEGMTGGNILVIGDRLDTDIAAANAAGLDSLFVLGGAHGLRELVFCPREARPTYFGMDLSALVRPPAGTADPDAVIARVEDGAVRIEHTNRSQSDTLGSVVRLGWQVRDSGEDLSPDAEAWRILEQHISGVDLGASDGA